MENEITNLGKSFWQKKDGKVGGTILLVAAAALGIFFWGSISSWVLRMMVDTFHISLFAAGFAFVAWCLINDSIRTTISYAFKSLARAITTAFIKYDPIGTLLNYVDDLKKSRVNMKTQIDNLSGQKALMEMKIVKNNKTIAEKEAMIKAARNKGNVNVATVEERQKTRIEKSNEMIKPLLSKINAIMNVIQKLYENSDYAIQDIENEVEIQRETYEMVKKGYNAIQSAISIFRGNPNKKAMFDQAMEVLENNISFKVGAMDSFLKEVKTTIEKIDIENDMYSENNFDKLQQLGENSLNVMLAPIGTNVPVQQKVLIPIKQVAPAFDPQKTYDELLK